MSKSCSGFEEKWFAKIRGPDSARKDKIFAYHIQRGGLGCLPGLLEGEQRSTGVVLGPLTWGTSQAELTCVLAGLEPELWLNKCDDTKMLNTENR